MPAPRPLTDAVRDHALGQGAVAGHQFLIPVSGRSMWPLLRDGDVVRVQPGAPLRRGDVVVFRRDEGLVIHRLLRFVVDDGLPALQTRGDNVPHFDPPISPTAVLGRVVAVRGAGRERRLDAPAGRRLNRALTALMLLRVALGDPLRRRLGPRGRRLAQVAWRHAQQALAVVATAIRHD